MPPRAGRGAAARVRPRATSPPSNDVLVTPVREGAQDDWSRFEGASAAIGHFIRMVHEGRMSKDEGWEGDLRLQRRHAAAAAGRSSG